MAILNKSSGSLFPLINDIREKNEKNESTEPKLKRNAGTKSDVRVGDGMTVILTKIWGTLKKQEDFTKAFKKNIADEKKFKKESKDLMKKNHQVILNSLNVLNKDVTKVLTKLLDVNEKSAKEETKRLDEAERAEEIKQDFSKETFRERESDSERRHKELLEALKGLSGGEGKTKRQKKTPFEKLLGDLKKDMSGFSEGLLAGVFGRSIAKFLVSTLPGLISTAVSSAIGLVLSNPLSALAVAMAGLSAYMAESFRGKEIALNEAAKKGDIKSMREEAERQATQIDDPGVSANTIIRDRLKKANTPQAIAAIKQLDQQEKDEALHRQHGPTSRSMIIQTVKGKVDSVNRGQQFPGNFTLPVNEGVLSSAMKENRTIKGITKDHNGVDIAVPYGSPVNPIADGEILQVGQDAASGKYVRVKHQGGMVSSYAHLSAVNDKLKVGQTVTTKDVIASSGGEGKDAGRSTGAHLHLGLRDASGQWVDPQRYIPELSGVQEKTKVAKGEAGSGTMLASSETSTLGGMLSDSRLSSMFPDLNSLVSTALSDAQSMVNKSASFFQDTGVKTTQTSAIDRMNEQMLAQMSLKNNNQSSPTNITTINNVASAGGSGGPSLPTISSWNRDSTLERAQYGMLRPVTGIT